MSPASGATVTAATQSVTLSWLARAGATGYVLWVDGNQVLITSAAQTSYMAWLPARTRGVSGAYGGWSATWGFTSSQSLPNLVAVGVSGVNVVGRGTYNSVSVTIQRIGVSLSAGTYVLVRVYHERVG